jgi:hypothetical protein
VARATSRKAGVSTRSCALVAAVIRGRHYRRGPELRDAGAASATILGPRSASTAKHSLDSAPSVSLDL